jgi:hypothetical protein
MCNTFLGTWIEARWSAWQECFLRRQRQEILICVWAFVRTQIHACVYIVDHVFKCYWCRIQLSLVLRECNHCTSRAVSVCSDDLQLVGCFYLTGFILMTLPVGVGVWCEIIGWLVKNEWGRMCIKVERLRKITKVRILSDLVEFQTRDLWNAGQKSYTWSHIPWNSIL